MKKIIFVFSLLSSIISFPQVNWMTMNQALEAQKRNPKKILVDFYADWCGPCKLMEKNTFGNIEISKYINDNFYAVKFDAEGNEPVTFDGKQFGNPKYDANKRPNSRGYQHQFARYMNVVGYPSTVFLDTDGTLITGLVGYFEAKDVEPYLVLIATEEYKKVKTQEEWDHFKSKFKGKVK